jgi:serine/threonine protein kinase
MYTDTKTSCESVTTASRANDDPELVALHRNYRTQKDRLLAWGLDWSDSNAAQPNDIDESLTEAGFSDVVASVMSSIQEILNEAERLQHVDAPALPPKGARGDLPSKDDLSHLPIKMHWAEEDIKRSYTLLNDLTACIDTLYDLSRSRRDMSMSMSSSEQTKSRSQATSKLSRPTIDSFRSLSVDSKSPSAAREFYESPVEMKGKTSEVTPFSSFRPQLERPHVDAFSGTKRLYIDRSALQLSGDSHAKSPPPYEQVVASANSRIIGRIQTSATPFLTGLTKESTVPILVEFTPIMLESQNSITTPAAERLEKLHRSLHQLIENSRVSHLGLLRFLGYYIDMANARYAFVYQMPIDYFPFLSNPSNLLKELRPKTLVSLFHSGDEHQDIPMPPLESRFRLAYNLFLAVLHLRSQNVVHGNINSSNILIFPGLKHSNTDEIGSLTEDLRHPYLTSLTQFSGNELSHEPLSSSMYRHPDDKRLLDDGAAWSYDLYSLGFVLLEIGLWTPISRLWKMKYNNVMFKQRIENVYIKKLASKCGNAYLHLVQLCLDAPNFFLSTEPMADLSLRVPQIYTYPALELAEPDSAFAFSTNFLFTLSKISWRCCAIDIFSPPPAEDLDDCLPLALGQDLETVTTGVPSSDRRQPETREVLAEQNEEAALGSVRLLSGESERRVKKRTLKKLTNVEIPQQHLNEWNFCMLPKLSKLLQKVLRDSSESCSATLMMTGETVDTAKTTICVTCSNVKKVRSALKKYFEIDQDWDLIVLRGDVTRSKVPKRRRRKPQSNGPVNSNEPAFAQSNLNPHYQQRPLCGASIGAFRNEEHLPPVSYGGAILVDGMPFGMTVHHMLEIPSDDEYDDDGEDYPPRSSANWAGDMGTTSADFSYTWCDDDIPETHYELEISDDEDGDTQSVSQDLGDYWLSDEESSDDEGFDPHDAYTDEDAASIGDTAGIIPDEEPQLVVTQPAIDDVHEDFFPTVEDRDDEHLASHMLGYVHASSGLRRWTRKGMKHEIDWALIQLDENRIDLRNVILAGAAAVSGSRNGSRQRRGQAPIQLNKVARLEELGGLNVHCCGRTSGLQSGQISRAMTLVKLRGRQTFSTSFCVDGNFGGELDTTTTRCRFDEILIWMRILF